ncbi:hypothetical protein Hamer_G026702 [Homarus americanus]|uniref:Uncharacterized protein n=1 Tax=Homarus americanus TaxID=6706 RepID=A0A8J5JCC0_HOMAM|nr:hypothetical protein Hamer_G026702 [Homarus americanus]
MEFQRFWKVRNFLMKKKENKPQDPQELGLRLFIPSRNLCLGPFKRKRIL